MGPIRLVAIRLVLFGRSYSVGGDYSVDLFGGSYPIGGGYSVGPIRLVLLGLLFCRSYSVGPIWFTIL